MSLATDRVSSHGSPIISGAKKISIKVSRNANSTPKLDSSTLDLSNGSSRTYEDGLTDNGSSGASSGNIVTVSAEGLGTKPVAGDTINTEGATCKCMESSYDDNVGELRGWSASYTSDYSA